MGSPANRPSGAARARGFSLIEVLIAAAVVTVAGMAGVSYVSRASQHADAARERVFARHKALSILSELRAYVEGGQGEVAADLDGFDDGLTQNPTLSIAPNPNDPGVFIDPDHPLSGNIADRGEWRWFRRITVRRFPGVNTRDLRICTVRMFRHLPTQALPGEQMAEVSSVVRTIGDAYPTTQVYDVYLLALEQTPGWWVYMDSIKPFVEATLTDLESRNPGLKFRTHWITESGYGRDDRYAPYVNETRISTDPTAWAYVYPGKMPAGSSAERYYVSDNFRARMNLDGAATPTFLNEYAASEAYTDSNGNGLRDAGEPFVDADGDDVYDLGNPMPYALADQFNHAKRWPDEDERFARRVAYGLEVDDAPTWRLLLDRMIADPAKYHNAILINLHGELLPMPPVRNYSDAAKDPAGRPGWRVVAHPERVRPRRTAGSDTSSDVPRWRVYGYKTEFPTTEPLMTLREPLKDLNGNGVADALEPFTDWNGNGAWDAGVPITLEVPGADFSANPNGAANPSLIVKRLPGGIDANGDGSADAYQAFANAPRYPEAFTDGNGDGVRNVASTYFDRNGNGAFDAGEPYVSLDGTGTYVAADEALTDGNGNGRWDRSAPADTFTDTNANGKWDAAEPWFDITPDGVRNAATAPVAPWRAWNPAIDDVSPASRSAYAAAYGEPYKDVNGNGAWNGAETITFDANSNGVADGGYARGEMWFECAYDGLSATTVVRLHGTPLYCPETADGRGLDAAARLYDLEYVPCPMINTASSTAPPFERDLYNATANVPKNTARWTVEIPLAKVRQVYETSVGANNGDAVDRLFTLTCRLGADRTTGAMWPTANAPENLSKTYAWFHASPDTVPWSERYQFQGDPRHCPYADLDRYGLTTPHGHNWDFDNFSSSGTNAQANWLAFDAARLRNGWLGRTSLDVGRYTQWLRTAITKTEAVYTTLTGFSYYYLSVGGDVGYDSANGFPSSVPMNGTPFGNAAATVYEDTIAGGGTAGLGGDQKYVRSANGAAAGIRSGGYWWSKPWIGELYQDSAFATQWRPWGNLTAATGTSALTYKQVRRQDVTTAQFPTGTDLGLSMARLNAEGCTSVFNIGTSASTFHHQYQDGTTGNLTGDGPQLAANYNFPVPTTAGISRPFGLATGTDGGVGDEFSYTTEYPRYAADTVVNFYGHSGGQKGSALLRLREPGNARAGYVVVNGIDRTIESGSAFIARYSMLSLIHSYFAAGDPAGVRRIKQLPRLQIVNPTIVTELNDPASIAVQWHLDWQRWDGLKYTNLYASTFAETQTDQCYVLLYSRDNGRTWLNMKDESVATPGVLPWIAGVGPDPARTKMDAVPAGDETFTWATPAASFPEGTYLIRIEGYRTGESLHYAHHQEKIYVSR
jgi:prepilin-type N-terminal cleavage/methylation domain-containing protein